MKKKNSEVPTLPAGAAAAPPSPTYLLGVKVFPTLRVELAEEGDDAAVVHEVDERVAHVALVLEVDGQVEKVVGAPVGGVYLLEEHRLRVLVRDVPDHDRRALVHSLGDLEPAARRRSSSRKRSRRQKMN